MSGYLEYFRSVLFCFLKKGLVTRKQPTLTRHPNNATLQSSLLQPWVSKRGHVQQPSEGFSYTVVERKGEGEKKERERD